MQSDSIEIIFLSIFAFITFFIFLTVSKYSYKFYNGILLDRDFLKPQAFHNTAVSRSGGIASIICLFIFFGINYILYSKIPYEYFFICSSLFLIGYLDDIKVKISPNIRLMLMVFFLIIFIIFLPINIFYIDLTFLSFWLENKIFSTIFTLFCFLFIVNGANLIDGFNGLLTIHVIIINCILLSINLNNNHFEFSFFLTAQIMILTSFFLFNFPKAKMFLGDGGSYLFGSIITLNTIVTNNLNSYISTFFFCILLFYIFFEVFFSFFRKILQKKSPLLPDQNHLHMLVYKYLKRKFPSKDNNYLTSIFVNTCYFILILPAIYFMDNTIFIRCWFFILLVFYAIFYLRLYKSVK